MTCQRCAVDYMKGRITKFPMGPSESNPRSHIPHSHPPGKNPSLRITAPNLEPICVGIDALSALPALEQTDCYIVSTGHGTSGPFRFAGPTLAALASRCGIAEFESVRVTSGDRFFTILTAQEVALSHPGSAVMLALYLDGHPLSREQGLVRLIVPTEKRDALKQIKWVSHLEFRTAARAT